METKKWAAMLTAIEQGSFTKAAEKLGCTQSGLTHMMDSLEKEVGFPLLTRGRSGVRCTPEGERLLPAVRSVMEAVGRLERDISVQNAGKRENIRVAAYSSICMHWLPTIVQQFRWAYPDVSVDIRMGSVDETYRWLQEGKVELSFVSRQEDQGEYQWIPLWDDPMLAILPAEYPICPDSRFPVEDFDGKEFLMPALGFEKDIGRVFQSMGVHPDIRDTTVEDVAIISMVEHGLGISILSELVLEGLLYKVKSIPLDPPAYRHMGIAIHALDEATPMVQELVAFSQRIVPALHRTVTPDEGTRNMGI